MKYILLFFLLVVLGARCSSKAQCDKNVETIAVKIVNDSTIKDPTVNYLERLRKLFSIPDNPSDSLVVRFWFGTGDFYRYAELVELRRVSCVWSANFYGFRKNDSGNLDSIYSKQNVSVIGFAHEINFEFGRDDFYLCFRDSMHEGGADGVEYVVEIDYLRMRKTTIYSTLNGDENLSNNKFRRGRHFFSIIQKLMEKQGFKIILRLKDVEV